MTEFPLERRNLLRATGAGLLGTAGASQTTGAQETSGGDLVWAFTQPSDEVNSSPTVADGTVYVGSWDGTLYAVDAATGSQEWAFTQPSGGVFSSPTVVTDTESGDSIGSRVMLGTLGHTATGGGSGGDGFGPGFGPGAVLAGLGGAGYLLKRRGTDDTDSS